MLEECTSMSEQDFLHVIVSQPTKTLMTSGGDFALLSPLGAVQLVVAVLVSCSIISGDQ